MRCRICDELIDNPKQDLTDDGVCKKKCALASEGLFSEDADADAIATLLIEEDILYFDYLLEGNTSDYE